MFRRNLCLSMALVAVLVAGCEDSAVRPDGAAPILETQSTGALYELAAARVVYADGPTWEGWTFREPGQAWVDQTTDSKWIAFEPQPNKGYSPEFIDAVNKVQVDVEFYLPPDFPLSGNSNDVSTIISLLTYHPDASPRPDLTGQFALEFNRSGVWRVRSLQALNGRGVIWDSGDRFILPFTPQHGWNRLSWTTTIEPGSNNDSILLTLNGQRATWHGAQVQEQEDEYRLVRLGSWRDTRGERQFAVRGLVVRDTGAVLPPPPPGDDDPPGGGDGPPPGGGDDPPPGGGDDPPPGGGDDPPPGGGDDPPPGGGDDPPPGGGDDPPPGDDDEDNPPPPPPPPPPSGDVSQGGYVIQEGFWRYWRARTHAQGSNCEGTPCIRFFDRGGFGAFRAGSQAIRFIGDDTDGQGTVSYRIRFDNGQLDTGVGGKHLFNLTSLPMTFTPGDIGLDNWTRVDFNQPGVGEIRATVFNNVNGDPLNGGAWPSHTYDVPFAVGSWADVDISWQQQNDRLTLTVNGQSHTFTLLDNSPNVGSYIAFGNIYNIDGEIDVDDITWSQ